MNTAAMKCWSITSNQAGFTAPELLKYRLQGEIYDDSRGSFPNGTQVCTSPIRRITDCVDHKAVETASTVYTVRPEDVDPEYEAAFPGAYGRLDMKGAIA